MLGQGYVGQFGGIVDVANREKNPDEPAPAVRAMRSKRLDDSRWTKHDAYVVVQTQSLVG